MDLETLVHACLPYLSHNQPNLLLETCETSLTALVQFDPDIMWLLLHQLVPMEMTPPLHPSLLPYEVYYNEQVIVSYMHWVVATVL